MLYTNIGFFGINSTRTPICLRVYSETAPSTTRDGSGQLEYGAVNTGIAVQLSPGLSRLMNGYLSPLCGVPETRKSPTWNTVVRFIVETPSLPTAMPHLFR